MKKTLKKLDIRKQNLNCPNCKQKINVPIKSGKTLRISCPKCRCQFEIRFANPLKELFKWNKNKSIKQNFSNFSQNFKRMPLQARIVIGVFFILCFLLLGLLINAFI